MIPKNMRGIIKLIQMLDNISNKNKNHKYLVYQRNKYHNIPLWVTCNALTFGQISKMFEFLLQNIQGLICQDFGNIKKNEMIKYLKVLTLYRNVCAHNERLFLITRTLIFLTHDTQKIKHTKKWLKIYMWKK